MTKTAAHLKGHQVARRKGSFVSGIAIRGAAPGNDSPATGSCGRSAAGCVCRARLPEHYLAFRPPGG